MNVRMRFKMPSSEIYCEDCVFYNRYTRKGCSSPQNLIKKKYKNLVTRRTNDLYIQRWTNIEELRLSGKLTALLLGKCGKDALWFQQATPEEIKQRQ